MATIYLRHGSHGECVFASEMEASIARSNGWTDFDPHAKSVPSFLAPSSDLPSTFPGREALIEGGFSTWESLVGKTNRELQEIKGIGASIASRILEVMDS